MDIPEKISSRRLKSFVRNLCLITKRHQDREKARIELKKKIMELKRFTSKKKEMDQVLKELDDKISLVLEKERQLLGISQQGSGESRALTRNVLENQEKIKRLNYSIDALKQRIDDYIDIRTARDRRVKELESKIKQKVKVKEDFALLKGRLNRLENMYSKLKRQGANVTMVEDRINDLRLRLS